MNKEKEIEEMADFIAANMYVRSSYELAVGLQNMGYRKADDSIVLPYKQSVVFDKATLWRLFYRNDDGILLVRDCWSEREADAFLKDLKGEKQ